MRRLLVSTAAVLAAFAFTVPAEAKVQFPLQGRTLMAGAPLTVRVSGCSASKPCRWGAGLVVSLVRSPGAHYRPIPEHGRSWVGRTNAYGLLRGRVPRVRPDAYVLVVTMRVPDGRGHVRTARAYASGSFVVRPEPTTP